MLPGSFLFPITPFTILCHFLAILALIGFPFVLVWTVKKWRSLNSNELKWAWLFIGACYSFILFLHYPGYVGYDDLNTGSILITGQPTGWQSLTYSAFLEVSMLLTRGYGLPAFVFVFTFMTLLLRLFSVLDHMEIHRSRLIFLAITAGLLALHPFHQCLLIYDSRDILFSLGLCHIGFFLLEKTKWTTASLILISLCIVFLSDVRQEAKIYLLFVPFAFFLNNQWQWRQLKIYIPSVLVFGYFYFGPIASYFNIDPYSRDYKVTALVLPLSQIFHDLKPDEISTADVANINAVLDVKKLKDDFNPIDIDPFHDGAYNYKSTPEEWTRFLKSAKNLIFKHFALFIHNRILLVKSALNLSPRPLIYNDELRYAPNLFAELRKKMNIPASRFTETGWPQMHTHFILAIIQTNSWFQVLLSSMVIPMLILFASLFYIANPAIILFGALIAIRLPILFLAAPASYVKYIYSVQIYSTLIFILLLGLWAKKSPNKSDPELAS